MDKYKNNILIPTALAQFENTPSLKFRYSNDYDLYIHDNYTRVKGKWFSGGISAPQTESKSSNTELNSFSKIETEIVIDSNQAEEINNLIEKNTTNYVANTFFDSSISTDAEIKVKKFKTKKNKKNNNTRQVDTQCPYCASKLITNNFGMLECSGDKLETWIKEFIKYNSFNEEKRKLHLNKYNDPTMFIEMFERWCFVDEKGKKEPFKCIYTNRLGNPVSRIRTSLYDPIQVMVIEKSLGDILTEQEKSGEVEIYTDGKSYYRDFKLGRRIVKINQLIYPDSFI